MNAASHTKELDTPPLSSSRPSTAVPRVARPEVIEAKRVVVKIGTRALLNEGGALAHSRLVQVVSTLAGLRQGGREVVIVSSGAVGLGRAELSDTGFDPGAEVCAAVGQGILIGTYQRAFGLLGLSCGQVLLSQRDVDDRSRSVRLGETLSGLLRQGVVPIVNENDTVELGLGIETTEGVQSAFSDNDRLAALIAGLLGADLLVVLTDVHGVCDRDPTQHDDASLIETVDFGQEGVEITVAENQGPGRGGMASKLSSAAIAARGGCGVVIASGRAAGSLSRLLGGEAIGTWIPPHGRLLARDRWIAFSPVARGFLELDEGAVTALRERGASLLATGVVSLGGEFKAGDVIELRDPDDLAIGRAHIRYDALTVVEWLNSEPRGITVIRRSDIVLDN